MNKPLETTIPFDGFYESLHDSMINDAIMQMFQDDDGTENAGLSARVFEDCRFKQVHEKYAQCYAQSFSEVFGLPSLKFDKLQSPREYNFTTDRIFCTIDSADVNRVLAAVDKGVFRSKAADMFTSRSGFASFYNPDIDTWPDDVSDWDCNQIGCLIAAWADMEHGGEFDSWAEYDMMQDLSGSGYLDNWVYEATPGIERLYKISDYLRMRAERDN